MTMNNIPGKDTLTCATDSNKHFLPSVKSISNGSIQKDKSLPRNKTNPSSSNSNISTSPQFKETTKVASFSEDKVQVELMEIINDFKNNVHSITQAEKLVEEWKNRNDVQKSFQEKTDQLNEMRKKYEKMQNEMKTTNNKTSLFDRVAKFFARDRSKDMKSLEKEISLLPMNSRPISSLSIQSTSSELKYINVYFQHYL